MRRPARVLWLTKGLGRGGAETLLVTGARHLDRQRFDVEVAYLLPWKDALVPHLSAEGLKVHCLGQGSSRDLRWIPRLRRLLNTGEFDLVHTHMPVPAVATRVLSRRRGGPAIVHSEHNVWQRYRRPTYWANALTYRRNDAVVAVSDAVRRSMQPRFLPPAPATVEVLLHGVEFGAMRSGPQARASARALLGLPEDAYVVGTVANFTPKKDTRRLIDAVHALHRKRSHARLVLIGTGPLEGDLKRHVRGLGLEHVVTFTGSRDDVPQLLPAFDVFSLPSLHEGLSIALVEAMASGVPAVCSRVGGIPEAMRHEIEGILVPPGDSTALYVALDRLCEDTSLRARYAAAALQRGRTFDIGAALRRTEDLYDEVLARR